MGWRYSVRSMAENSIAFTATSTTVLNSQTYLSEVLIHFITVTVAKRL